MPQLVHSHHNGNYFKRQSEQKDKFNVIMQDFVVDYNHTEERTANSKAVQKRKLMNDDWNWAPYPRRIKTHCDDGFDNSGYLSDGLNDSQIVPSWEGSEQESNDLMYCSNDPSDSKSADIHIVTIEGLIEFDKSESSTGHDFEEQPISFDMEQLCEIVRSEEGNGKDLTIDQQENALNMLLKFTNKPQLVLYEDNPLPLEGVKQIELPSDLYELNESSTVDVTDELKNDCQVEELKFARCFKCRRKVHTMQDCPRHQMKGSTVKNK